MKNNMEFLTARQVSEYLQIPLRTVHYLSQQGKIKAIKIGGKWRYAKEDIERYLCYGTDFAREPANTPNNFIRFVQEGVGFVKRRAYSRINSNFRCRYSVSLPPFREIDSEGIIKNISAGGSFLLIQNRTIGEIEIDDPICLNFNLICEDKTLNIEVKARVIRKSNDGLGIKFRAVNKEDREAIEELVG